MIYNNNKMNIASRPGLADEQLIHYFINTDPAAMKILTELYKDRIYTSIVGMIHDKNKASAIFGEVFRKIIDNMMAGNAVAEGKFLSLAMTTAHELCIEHNQDADQSKMEDSQAGNYLATAVMIKEEVVQSHNKIRNMIDKLPEQQRKVMLLNHYGGLSFNEIAKLNKCSLTSALETMCFGLRSLQKLMNETVARC